MPATRTQWEPHNTFYTPEQFLREQAARLEAVRGRLLIASCESAAYMSRQVVGKYQALLAEAGSNAEVLSLEGVDFRFADSETGARLDGHVAGYDVFVLQALYDPTSERSVDQNYMALLISARALREHGAHHVTAVLPYLAYARQDKPTRFKREPTTVKLMADLTGTAGIERIITWHPHSPHLHGFYQPIAVHVLESLPLFVEIFQRFQGREDVIAVAPDAGASKLVTYFARGLNINSAIASKQRPRPEKAVVTEVIGDFTNKRVAIVLDDMISSGGTVYSVVKKLVEEKGIEEIYVAASHNLCRPVALERLLELHADYHLQEVVVTNSIPQTERFFSQPFFRICDLSGTFARVINRIHYNRSVDELFYREELS